MNAKLFFNGVEKFLSELDTYRDMDLNLQLVECDVDSAIVDRYKTVRSKIVDSLGKNKYMLGIFKDKSGNNLPKILVEEKFISQSSLRSYLIKIKQEAIDNFQDEKTLEIAVEQYNNLLKLLDLDINYSKDYSNNENNNNNNEQKETTSKIAQSSDYSPKPNNLVGSPKLDNSKMEEYERIKELEAKLKLTGQIL